MVNEGKENRYNHQKERPYFVEKVRDRMLHFIRLHALVRQVHFEICYDHTEALQTALREDKNVSTQIYKKLYTDGSQKCCSCAIIHTSTSTVGFVAARVWQVLSQAGTLL